MRSQKSLWRFVLLLAVFALVAAACGDSDDASDETTTTAAAETTTTAAAETTTTAASTDTTEATTEPEMMEGQLTGMTVVDDNTFTVELTNADPEFPLRLAYAAYFAMPRRRSKTRRRSKRCRSEAARSRWPAPWEHDVRISLEKYADYQGPDPAKIDTFDFEIIAEIATAYNEALAGNLDVMASVPTENLSTYQTDFPDRNDDVYTTGFAYIGFPTYLPQFTKEHRQALSMAVDREAIAEKIFLGGRDAAFSVIPPNLQGRDFVCDSWSYNPEMAKAALGRRRRSGPDHGLVQQRCRS